MADTDTERCDTWGHTRSMPDPSRCSTCGADISRNATEAYAEIGRSLADELIAREESNETHRQSAEAEREYLYTSIRDIALSLGIDAERAHLVAWRSLPLFQEEKP